MNSGTPFSRLIRQRRVALGMSPASLADLVGRSASSIRSWERGSSMPTDENVVRSVAAVLGIEEGTLRTAVGLPAEVPAEDPDEVGGERLAVFAGDTADQDDPSGQRAVDYQNEEDTLDEESVEQIADPTSAPVVHEDESGHAIDEPVDESEAVSTPEGDSAPGADVETQVTGGKGPDHVGRDVDVISGGDQVPGSELVAPAVAAGTSRTVTVPVSEPPDLPVARSYMNDPDQMMTYWIRTALTVALSVFLLIVLFWALGRLGDSIGQLWDLFKAGA